MVEGDAIELFADGWDDAGYKTTFRVSCRIDGKPLELGMIRLLVDGAKTTRDALNHCRDEGWDGNFPIPYLNYISVPEEIAFYQQITGILGSDKAVEVATLLHDASYLVMIDDDASAKAMVASEGFEKSLQRERGSIKAFLDG